MNVLWFLCVRNFPPSHVGEESNYLQLKMHWKNWEKKKKREMMMMMIKCKKVNYVRIFSFSYTL